MHSIYTAIQRTILLALLTTMVFLLPMPARAAFPITPANSSVAAHPVAAKHGSLRTMFAHHPSDGKPHRDPRKGIYGLLSLIFGCAVFLFPLNALAAIVLGIIGLNKRYKNHGMATAGLILGCLEIIAFVSLIILIANAFKGLTLDVM